MTPECALLVGDLCQAEGRERRGDALARPDLPHKGTVLGVQTATAVPMLVGLLLLPAGAQGVGLPCGHLREVPLCVHQSGEHGHEPSARRAAQGAREVQSGLAVDAPNFSKLSPGSAGLEANPISGGPPDQDRDLLDAAAEHVRPAHALGINQVPIRRKSPASSRPGLHEEPDRQGVRKRPTPLAASPQDTAGRVLRPTPRAAQIGSHALGATAQKSFKDHSDAGRRQITSKEAREERIPLVVLATTGFQDHRDRREHGVKDPLAWDRGRLSTPDHSIQGTWCNHHDLHGMRDSRPTQTRQELTGRPRTFQHSSGAPRASVVHVGSKLAGMRPVLHLSTVAGSVPCQGARLPAHRVRPRSPRPARARLKIKVKMPAEGLKASKRGRDIAGDPRVPLEVVSPVQDVNIKPAAVNKQPGYNLVEQVRNDDTAKHGQSIPLRETRGSAPRRSKAAAHPEMSLRPVKMQKPSVDEVRRNPKGNTGVAKHLPGDPVNKNSRRQQWPQPPRPPRATPIRTRRQHQGSNPWARGLRGRP